MANPNSTPHRFVAGAIDLGEVKSRAEARQQAAQSPGGISPVVVVTRDNVEAEVLLRSQQVPVIVLLGTARSPESEQLKNDFSQLAEASHKSFIFAYVDADSTPEIAQMFGIQGLPTVVALAAGRPLANFEGGQPLDALKQWTDAVVKAAAGQLGGLTQESEEAAPDPRFDAATDALNSGDFESAIAVYESILAQEPKNQMALQARDNARLLARLQTARSDVDPVAAADAAPHDVELAFAAADAEIAAGTPEAAFARLIAIVKENDEVRTRLLELFALFDPTDARVIAARGKMASALF
ncbi:co-chaperone YbbN [Corynebacterium pseudotuberculosis]|uniref:tetratricopeptide repeat protein n=1 Tax=Corynebacterium pseudotuberculosis TaxID=1719 RepID=UPI000737CAAD|nr:tetratricopeptide repeat protein [Corynebacterium pseudotuberculosis]ALU22135.1 co-chaperone YbbN [Corynebacterium pseudotuberculosis]ANH24483.1 Thioredoxin TrxA [Corynebacterium pseudotuberculosis]